VSLGAGPVRYGCDAWCQEGDTVNRTDLQQLAEERVRNAKVLLAAKQWSAAYYVAGYAVECGLKACIAKGVKAEEFPDRAFADKCWAHDLKQLVVVAGLKEQFALDKAADTDLAANWECVKDWTEARRYARTPKGEAEELFRAITDKKHGVLSWIKRYW
jgi:HEPN domain-containing protein